MKKLKQFIGTKMYRGLQYEVCIASETASKAAQVLETTTYNINIYFSKMPEVNIELLNKYPNEVFARFNSGLLGAAYPKQRNSWMTHRQVKIKIDHLRANPSIAESLGY